MNSNTLSTSRRIEPVDVLAQARRILWRLQVERRAIDPVAAAAVTSGRHGEQGRRWAKGIMEAVEAGEDVEGAIVRALTAAVA